MIPRSSATFLIMLALARSILIPERSIQEGQHGTLAEAEAHGDVALAMCELADETIVDAVNEQLVEKILLVNYGDEAVGKVRICRVPLTDIVRFTPQASHSGWRGSTWMLTSILER